MKYRNFAERTIDTQYRDLLQLILSEGIIVEPQQEERARMKIGLQMRFDLVNGFPLITERDLSGSFFTQSLGEMRAFWIKGARYLWQLEEEGCRWWGPWATPEKCAKRGLEPGDLGPASYGPALRAFPTETGTFDQVRGILEEASQKPHLRTLFISPWVPQHIGRCTDTVTGQKKQQGVVVAPCHGWVHLFLYPELRRMSLHHYQRSGDMPVGVPANMVGYAALTMMFAQVLGYEPWEYIHTVSDAHIYEGQIPAIQELLATEPQRLPTVNMDASVMNFFDFRPDHFTINDYHPQSKRRRIWTPV